MPFAISWRGQERDLVLQFHCKINVLTTFKMMSNARQKRESMLVYHCMCGLLAIQEKFIVLIGVMALRNFPALCGAKCQFRWSNKRVVDKSIVLPVPDL